MALAALDFFPKAQLWVIPADVPPVAGGQRTKTPGLPFDDRLALAEAHFIANLNPEYQSRVRVCSFEQQLAKPNYTAKTIAFLRREFKDMRFAFLMGQDQLASFPRWHSPASIIKEVALVVCSRAGHPEPIDQTLVRCIERLDGNAAYRGDHYFEGCFATCEQRFFVLDQEVSGAASETIRKAAQAGEPIDHWLTESVSEIITTHKLYGVPR